MTWTVDSSGTQTGTLGVEQTLSSPSVNATYVLEVDTNAMANGDILELRCYDKVDGTNLRQEWKGTFQHTQTINAKASPPMPVTAGAQFTLKQVGASVPISGVTGSVPDGSIVTGQTSGATAQVVVPGGGNVSGSTAILLWLSGTFTNGETVQLSVGNNFVLTNANGRAFPWSVRRI